MIKRTIPHKAGDRIQIRDEYSDICLTYKGPIENRIIYEATGDSNAKGLLLSGTQAMIDGLRIKLVSITEDSFSILYKAIDSYDVWYLNVEPGYKDIWRNVRVRDKILVPNLELSIEEIYSREVKLYENNRDQSYSLHLGENPQDIGTHIHSIKLSLQSVDIASEEAVLICKASSNLNVKFNNVNNEMRR